MIALGAEGGNGEMELPVGPGRPFLQVGGVVADGAVDPVQGQDKTGERHCFDHGRKAQAINFLPDGIDCLLG